MLLEVFTQPLSIMRAASAGPGFLSDIRRRQFNAAYHGIETGILRAAQFDIQPSSGHINGNLFDQAAQCPAGIPRYVHVFQSAYSVDQHVEDALTRRCFLASSAKWSRTV